MGLNYVLCPVTGGEEDGPHPFGGNRRHQSIGLSASTGRYLLRRGEQLHR